MKDTDASTMKRMLTTAPMKRLTRPANPRAFELTQRDIDILSFVARVDLATGDQIIRFTGGSEKNVATRIRLLFWHQFLNRPEHQRTHIAVFSDLGNTPLIYSIGPAGKQLLAQRGILHKRSRGKFPLLSHTVATTEFILSCAVASRAEGVPRLIDHADLLPFMPEATRALEHPFRFRVTHQQDFKPISLSVDPDRLISLEYADHHRYNFCIESDLGNETIASRHKGKIRLAAKSTFARKLAGYFHGWSADRHRVQWGWQGFRVLTITPSVPRIASMIDAQRQICDRAPSLFLYTTPARVAEHGAFAPIWISSERDGISIIDRR